MKVYGSTDYSISKIRGQFIDKQIEEEFRASIFDIRKRNLRRVALGLGISLFLFILPDYFILSSTRSFVTVLLARSTFLLVSLYLCWSGYKSVTVQTIEKWTKAYKATGTLCLLAVTYYYESPNFLINVLGWQVIIAAIVFLIPDKPLHRVITAAITVPVFIGIYAFAHGLPPINELGAAIVFMIAAFLISSIVAMYMSYFLRKNHITKKTLEVLLVTDPLTGTYNRLKIDEVLALETCRFRKEGVNLSVIIFDIDNYKGVNDRYGHIIGDKLIIDLVDVIKPSVREGDILARWGGDEFVIILPDTDQEQAEIIAQRLQEKVSNHQFQFAKSIACSFGVTSFTADDDVTSFLQRADEALYLAKERGKDQVASA